MKKYALLFALGLAFSAFSSQEAAKPAEPETSQKSEKLSLKKSPKDLASLIGGVALTTVFSTIFIYSLTKFIMYRWQEHLIEKSKNNAGWGTNAFNEMELASQAASGIDYANELFAALILLTPLHIYTGVKLAKDGWQLKHAKAAQNKA